MADGLSLLGTPFAIGLLVLAGHVLLGREVLRRGIIFIDLCIAQVAAMGVVLAELIGVPEGIATGAVVAGSAVAAGLLLSWTEKRWPHLQEPIIGALYVLSAAFVMLLLSRNPHGAEVLDQLLAGQLLWVQWSDAGLLLAATAAVFVAAAGDWLRNRILFYLLFALTVTTSVPLIGVFLVFASLILPALASQSASRSRALWLAYTVGVLGYAFGLLASLQFDLPSGPSVICCLALVSLIAAVFPRPS